jgi:hypothetical protein
LSGHGSTAGVYNPNITTPQASSTKNASSSLAETLDTNGKSLLLLPKTEFVDDFVARTRTASSDILLTWDNSTFARGSYVRIVRSPFFYPLDPLDGKVVYEGKGASARDTDMAQRYNQVQDKAQNQSQNQVQKYFYSIFLLNQKRAVISSAIATVTYRATSLSDPLIEGDNMPFVVSDTALEDEGLCVGEKGYVDLAEYTSSFKKSELSKLEISQGKIQNTLLRGNYSVVKNQPVYIRITSDAIRSLIPGNTTRVALCLIGDTPDIKKGYLFSYNSEGKFYEVTLPPFLRMKDYQFYVGMLKYKGVESILTAHKFAVVDKLGGTGRDAERIQDDRVNTLPFLQKIRDRGYLRWSTFKASAYEVVQKFLNIFGW